MPSHADDMALVQAARKGQSRAWQELLRRHQDRLFAVCVRMVGRRDHAADLAQDAFVKIIEGLDSYDGRASLATWMTRITMNVCLSWLRSQKLRRHASLDGNGPDQTPETAGHGAGNRELSDRSRVESDERRTIVAAALLRIPPEHRAILVLRDVRGLEYDHIAHVLDVPVGTIKSRLFRARSALREELEKVGVKGVQGRTEV